MKRLLKKAHLYYYQIIVALVFASLYPFLYYYSRLPVKFHGMNRVRYVLSLFTSSLSGIFYRFKFEQEIDWNKPYIICPNHTSNLDISTVILLSKRNFVFLGKDELLDNFITGIYFKTIDIPLNRNSKFSSYRAFKRAEEYLQKGITVAIFPEGLISNDYPPELYPFKNGPFRLAIEQKIPIIPVTICNNWKICWDDGSKFGTRPGVSEVFVHKPIETDNLTILDAETLKDQVFDIINQKLKSYQAGLYNGGKEAIDELKTDEFLET
ncbi:lysophospholipid acyltransferase family protein [Daejeonella oryzae]|uniref:lysophospholipid acyltransferase family protein n=1 Tax=Daejeonella oryzae TaxID=1122943 RepID=UPI0006888998|nr:lysophospholipid acyltransferase family protein [Daejeonella oryzae]